MTQGAAAFSALPNAVRCIWAKSGDERQTGGHGLLAHMVDVAAVVEVMLMREPPSSLRMCAQSFGLPTDSAARWVAALAGLHDFGKAIPGFQAKWPAGQRTDEASGLPFAPAVSLKCDRHSLATAALLTPLLQVRGGAAYLWCQHVVQAVSAHHGYHFTTSEINDGSPLREPEAWPKARQLMLDAYWEVLRPQGTPTADECSLPIVNWLAGLTSAADWIASNTRWFPLGERHDDLQAYHQHALHLAEQALPQLGWHIWRPLLDEPASVESLLPQVIGREGAVPRPLQREADRLLSQSTSPALLLVEAPMGEGKTELAFLAHLRLQAANQHRGLYVALPTQATGNALFRRAKTFLQNFASGPLDAQLVHGGAAMSDDLAALRSVGDLQGVGDAPADNLAANAWFGQRSRPLLSPYGVGTVDQALYAVLNVKHHFVRLWGLSNRVVVLDEVHAYDTYTSGLIDALLRWLKALNCSVVLMSATLPRARSRELVKAWGVSELPAELPYPRLVLADSAGARGNHVEARSLAPIELKGVGSSVEALAALAMSQVGEGGCGAIIVNTVSRAQGLYRLLRQLLAEHGLADVELLLFHARFPADDRQELETRVMQRFGANVERPARALLVATQVAEQSLDIDFDFMISDLAPVDLLLQRAGRLHRHQRDRRPSAHAHARLWVAGLLPEGLPDLKGTAWGFVYAPYILGRTWALLVREAVLHLPQDIDRLVQAVYDRDHELPDDLEAQAREFIEVQAYGEFRSKVKEFEQMAANIVIDPADEAHVVYDRKPRGHEEDESGLGLTNTTRQGQETVTVVPVIQGEDGLWHVRAGDVGFDAQSPLCAVTARALYGRQIKLGRKRLVKQFHAQPIPPAFAGHALLRHMWPLPLRDGRSVDEALRLLLSPELGLVYDDVANKDQVREDAE
ncbi:MAG: CRISPR-associated helicase Cas3' [Roseateles asaccharophilus]|uniref:CRISPR-associated helicase Cas3' n=1 Tax=Roseateles asaccharophilus TaxID=582607 RepID=UPI003918A230